jgi:hypothetical protein
MRAKSMKPSGGWKPQRKCAGGVEEGSQVQARRGPQPGSPGWGGSAQRLEYNLVSGPRAESARRCYGHQFRLHSIVLSGRGSKWLVHQALHTAHFHPSGAAPPGNPGRLRLATCFGLGLQARCVSSNGTCLTGNAKTLLQKTRTCELVSQWRLRKGYIMKCALLLNC